MTKKRRGGGTYIKQTVGVPTTLQHDEKSPLEDAVAALRNCLTQHNAHRYVNVSTTLPSVAGAHSREVLFNDIVGE
jgi:hypothetical protein